MTNENLNPPEADERFDSFHDSNVDEAEGLVLEDILDNDNSDLVTMEELPGGLDTNRKFKDIVIGLAGHNKFKVDHDQLLKKLGEIWWLHIKEGIESDDFNEQLYRTIRLMYEPDPDYGRDDA
tara:strand:+ start:243 stop:611 length:369 start_codon:yes stop_codon:yes gene_type:complete